MSYVYHEINVNPKLSGVVGCTEQDGLYLEFAVTAISYVSAGCSYAVIARESYRKLRRLLAPEIGEYLLDGREAKGYSSMCC